MKGSEHVPFSSCEQHEHSHATTQEHLIFIAAFGKNQPSSFNEEECKKNQMATVLNAVFCILHLVTQLYFSSCVDPLHQEPQVFKNKTELLRLHRNEQISVIAC